MIWSLTEPFFICLCGLALETLRTHAVQDTDTTLGGDVLGNVSWHEWPGHLCELTVRSLQVCSGILEPRNFHSFPFPGSVSLLPCPKGGHGTTYKDKNKWTPCNNTTAMKKLHRHIPEMFQYTSVSEGYHKPRKTKLNMPQDNEHESLWHVHIWYTVSVNIFQ
jgi:hypothetical protein